MFFLTIATQLYSPVWIGVALVQLELHLADVRAHVLVVEGLDVDRPLVGVAVALALLPKVATDAAVDDGLHHAHPLHPLSLAAGGGPG